jgi:hypothetical protein
MMAKYSMKVKGKEVGPAEVYAPPHTMDGKPTNVATYSKTESGAKRQWTRLNMSLVFTARATTLRSILMELVSCGVMALLPRVARSAGKWDKS